jgi:hypothetical protein
MQILNTRSMAISPDSERGQESTQIRAPEICSNVSSFGPQKPATYLAAVLCPESWRTLTLLSYHMVW